MTKKEAKKKGARYYCPGCMTAYVNIPKYWEDSASCEGSYITQCRHCDCDLICHINDDSLVKV